MSGLTLQVDGARWSAHQQSVRDASPGLVPVIKGNGYGFGHARLARAAAELGVSTVAVGMSAEVPLVREAFDGDIVILYPWRPGDPVPADPQVLITVTRVADVAALADSGARVLLEVLTSMRRHGLAVDDLGAAVAAAGSLPVEGWTIHLPITEAGRLASARELAAAARAAVDVPLWLSHLPAAEARTLGEDVRLRIGTSLWLGAPSALTTTATVLDLHRVRRGDRAGYRLRAVPGDGWIVVLAGGTSHGVGLEAPTPAASVRQRAIALATGGLEAAGRALSPYTLDGRKRWFLEPPHMQSSLVFLPASATPPSIGDEVPVQLRLTTATVDEVQVS